eukprot:scaffold107506_cov37-Tisochrysis_lutea.AAC.1
MGGSNRKSPPPERRSRSMPNHRVSFARSKSRCVGAIRIPPSMEVRCLMAWREKQHKLPCDPSFLPLNLAPKAWAQSSMTAGRKPNLAKQRSWIAATRARSMGEPPQCTTMITLVVGVSFASRSSRHILHVAWITETGEGVSIMT